MIDAPEPDAFDPSHLSLPARGLPPTRSAPRPPRSPRHRPGEKFLKGPVPWPWVTRAAGLAGRALFVGLAVWRESGCRGKGTVPVNLSALASACGVSRSTAQRALKALAGAGLVAVEHRVGRPPLVTLTAAPSA